MQTIWQDIRFGLRMLGKHPAFTLVAVLTLALGIGANTAMFSLTDQVLLRRLAVQKPGELVLVRAPGPKRGHTSSDGDDAASISYPMYRDIRDKNGVFSGVLARFAVALSVAGQGETERVSGELVSGNYFEVLGVRPAIGRVFTQDDDRVPGGHSVIVLSYSYWMRHFGGDPNILNKTLLVNANSMTVVGVARAGFTGVQIGQLPAMFIPMMMKARITPNWDGLNSRTDHWLAILARLKPDMTRERAEAGLQPLFHTILEEESGLSPQWSAEFRKTFLARRIALISAAQGKETFQQDAKAPLLILTGMVGLVLLIACANVANLLIARGAARQREMALRVAMGATRGRLVRQLLAESVLLAVAGGVAGLMVALWTSHALIGTVKEVAGALDLNTQLDLRVLTFSLVLSVITGILSGLAPALSASRTDLQSALKEQGMSAAGGRGQVGFRKGLAISQVALTAVLLVGAGLFALSLHKLNVLDPGMRTDHVLEFSLAPSLNGYTPEQTTALVDRIRERVSRVPGVTSLGAAEIPILAGDDEGGNVTIDGYTPAPEEEVHVLRNSVGPNYFSAMGIPLLSGREFNEADHGDTLKVMIVNEALAQKYFAGRNPIGSRLAYGSKKDVRPDIEIVGVVKNSKHENMRDTVGPFLYLPYTQSKKLGHITFYVRTLLEPTTLAPLLREEIRREDANLPVSAVKTLDRQVEESLFAERMLTTLSMSLGILAAALAAIGLYGVMAYTVTLRTREIGIRMALGASRRAVAWLILREVAVMAVVGLAVGIPAAVGLGHLAEFLLFGVKAGNPLIFGGAMILLAAVAMLAGFLPAQRAASIDPMVALRHE